MDEIDPKNMQEQRKSTKNDVNLWMNNSAFDRVEQSLKAKFIQVKWYKKIFNIIKNLLKKA